MITWLVKKLALKAIGTALAPFKFYFIAAAIAAVVGVVGLYIYGAEQAKGQVNLLEFANTQLSNANAQAASDIQALNNRIKAHNAQKLRDIAEAAERLEQAREVAAVVAKEKDVIAEELAVVRFSILEAIRDDEDYADWAFYPAHPSIWLQISAADSGIPAE